MKLQQRRNRGLVIAVSLGVLLLIVAGGAVLVTQLGDGDDAATAAADATATHTPDTDGAQVEEHDSDLAAQLAARRDPDVPELPFKDNPDPTLCGIPSQWGEDGPAWLTGYYEGDLIQPVVYLYDSHNRLSITAEAPHGTPVEVVLFQSNPVTDYYMVRILAPDGTTSGEGWIPEPFLSFEPVAPLPDDA